MISLFPVQIYKTQFHFSDVERAALEDRLEQSFDSITCNQGFMRNNSICTYNEDRELHKWPELKSYADFISNEVNNYWKELGLDSTRPPMLYEMWANKYGKDSYIDEHNHIPIPIVITYYFKKPNNSGNTVFVNPNIDIIKSQPIDGLKNVNDYDSLFESEVPSQEGDIIMFPGWLRHKTRPCPTDNRIIITTNIIPRPR